MDSLQDRLRKFFIGMRNRYCWHGEPVKTKFGYCHIKEDTERPLFWYNFECSMNRTIGHALISAIEVTTNCHQRFCIANHFGIGVNKLIKGGWPDCTHFSLPADTFQQDDLQIFNIRKFDEEEFSKYEAERRKWQKKNYPVEFEESEILRRMIIKSKL